MNQLWAENLPNKANDNRNFWTLLPRNSLEISTNLVTPQRFSSNKLAPTLLDTFLKIN